MAKSSKNLSNKDLFQKEINRLKRLVKQAEKKGITFLSSPLPEQPKRVTEKKLQETRAIKLRDIEAKGFTIDKQTGELQPVKRVGRRSGKNQIEKGAEIKAPSSSTISTKKKNKKKKKSSQKKDKVKFRDLPKEEQKRRRSQWAKKGAETRRRNKQAKMPTLTTTPETSVPDLPTAEEPLIPEEQAPEEMVILDLLRQEIITGVNSNVADYLLDVLEDQIGAYGEEKFFEHIKNKDDETTYYARAAVNDSEPNKVFSSAMAFMELISVEAVSAFSRMDLEEAVERDFPYAGVARNFKRYVK